MTSIGSAAKALPSLIGVLWALTPSGRTGHWVLPIAVFAIGEMCVYAGERFARMGKFQIALWFINSSIVVPIAVVALCSAIVLWLSTNAFQGSGSQQKALSGALVGAVTAYCASVWMKDIADGAGPLWPSTRFKHAVGSAFQGVHTPAGTSLAFKLAFLDHVSELNIEGWGFRARTARARALPSAPRV